MCEAFKETPGQSSETFGTVHKMLAEQNPFPASFIVSDGQFEMIGAVVSVAEQGANSKAPMSAMPLLAMPRWSVGGAAAVLPLSNAGLPANSA